MKIFKMLTYIFAVICVHSSFRHYCFWGIQETLKTLSSSSWFFQVIPGKIWVILLNDKFQAHLTSPSETQTLKYVIWPSIFSFNWRYISWDCQLLYFQSIFYLLKKYCQKKGTLVFHFKMGIMFSGLCFHRMVEAGKVVWRSSGPISLLKQGHVE